MQCNVMFTRRNLLEGWTKVLNLLWKGSCWPQPRRPLDLLCRWHHPSRSSGHQIVFDVFHYETRNSWSLQSTLKCFILFHQSKMYRFNLFKDVFIINPPFPSNFNEPVLPTPPKHADWPKGPVKREPKSSVSPFHRSISRSSSLAALGISMSNWASGTWVLGNSAWIKVP